MTDLSSLRVTESQRAEGLARFHANARRSARSILVVFGVGAMVLGGCATLVDAHSRPWFIGAAIASLLCGGGIWFFTAGSFATGLASQAAALPWGEGLSFISPSAGLVFASPRALLLERSLFRTPPLFAHARYEASSHSIELGEPAPDSDGHYGTIDFTLPQTVTPALGLALAALFTMWWCGKL